MSERIYIVAWIIALLVFSGCVNEKEEVGNAVNGVKISGRTFMLEELSMVCGKKDVEGHTGVALDCVVREAGIENPWKYAYTVISSDSYQKTVKWGDMQKGVLTNESLAVFPHLPKMYWIRDVVEVRYNE